MAWSQHTLHAATQPKPPYVKGLTLRHTEGKNGKAPRYGDRTAQGGPYGKGTQNPKRNPPSKGNSLGKDKPPHKPRLC